MMLSTAKAGNRQSRPTSIYPAPAAVAPVLRSSPFRGSSRPLEASVPKAYDSILPEILKSLTYGN